MHEFGSFVVVLQKAGILWVFEAFAYVEGQRDEVKDVLANQGIVLFEVVEECLFIAQVKVVLQVVVYGVAAAFSRNHFQLLRVLLQLVCELSLLLFFELEPVLLVEDLLLMVHQLLVVLLVDHIFDSGQLDLAHLLAAYLKVFPVFVVLEDGFAAVALFLPLKHLIDLNLSPDKRAVGCSLID